VNSLVAVSLLALIHISLPLAVYYYAEAKERRAIRKTELAIEEQRRNFEEELEKCS